MAAEARRAQQQQWANVVAAAAEEAALQAHHEEAARLAGKFERGCRIQQNDFAELTGAFCCCIMLLSST